MAGQTANYLFDYPTSTDYVKDGATAIETLADDVDATLFTALGGTYPGLRLIKKQTIGTAVSSVNVTSAFSATYTNYKIIVSGGACSTPGQQLSLRVGNPGNNFYGALISAGFTGGAPASSGTNNQANWDRVGAANTTGLHLSAELQSPFLTTFTTCQSTWFDTNANTGTFTGMLNNQVSYTDFTITPSGGTLTGGTIYVYGYGTS
jgi:hypothetical protein